MRTRYKPVKPRFKERLEEGGMVCLDVGCGKGVHSALLAETYPNSNFSGIDITMEAVQSANQQRKSNGERFDNLAFFQMNAAQMDADWSEKFDLVTIFDACHDQMRPDLVNGTSNVFTDRNNIGSIAAQMYGCSLFHCLPVGSNSPG
ncbi:methyltransferase domain protein [Dictyocaulus viviparus]|uniref:Methyltransferase domain protein n=1 Tax=Dictyocaulus viviparus TaxID=29172 RepID=A0A0D8Y378_DICVI|nr:methyltransferase domain protein [Dictyocaulus viviparus]